MLSSSGVSIRCWVYDDGSDFDVAETIRSIGDERVILAGAPPIPAEERVRPGNTRWSTNVNWILSKMGVGETVTYLCDDDLLDAGWLVSAERVFLDAPSVHMVVGDMYYFNDGEDAVRDGRKGFPARIKIENEYLIWWNLGAFTHLTDCFFSCGVKWRRGHKDYPHSWDIQYISSLLEKHAGYVKIPVRAMYRREHPNTLSARAGRIEGGYYVRAAERIEPEDVSGMME